MAIARRGRRLSGRSFQVNSQRAPVDSAQARELLLDAWNWIRHSAPVPEKTVISPNRRAAKAFATLAACCRDEAFEREVEEEQVRQFNLRNLPREPRARLPELERLVGEVFACLRALADPAAIVGAGQIIARLAGHTATEEMLVAAGTGKVQPTLPRDAGGLRAFAVQIRFIADHLLERARYHERRNAKLRLGARGAATDYTLADLADYAKTIGFSVPKMIEVMRGAKAPGFPLDNPGDLEKRIGSSRRRRRRKATGRRAVGPHEFARRRNNS